MLLGVAYRSASTRNGIDGNYLRGKQICGRGHPAAYVAPVTTSDDYAGRRVLVTGGASGIGHAIAAGALGRGARVAVLDLEPGSAPAGALGLRADVSDDRSTAEAVEEAVAAMGGLDVVVNNAGIGAQGTVEANDLDEWRRVFEVNVFGMVRVMRAALPHLRRS